MYTFESRVRYSEIGEDGRITISSIIDYMQDCTNFQSEDLGVGIAYHKEHGLMWVLNSWQIIFDSYPKMGERISVGTQAYGFEKMFGYRNFLITDAQGKRIAIANSTWVLMDLKKGRPMMVTEEIGNVYGKAEPLEMEYAPRKIIVPDNGQTQESYMVREYHLDTNHHVNNGQYVKMAMGFLDNMSDVKELRVEYKKQARLGDEIVPVVHSVENGKIISLSGVDGKPYAVVWFLVA